MEMIDKLESLLEERGDQPVQLQGDFLEILGEISNGKKYIEERLVVLSEEVRLHLI
jgi:hypothetical protein